MACKFPFVRSILISGDEGKYRCLSMPESLRRGERGGGAEEIAYGPTGLAEIVPYNEFGNG